MKYYRHFCCPSYRIPVNKASFHLAILCILYNLIIFFAISTIFINSFNLLFSKKIHEWSILAIIFPLAAINLIYIFLIILGHLLHKPSFYLSLLIYLIIMVTILAFALSILIGLNDYDYTITNIHEFIISRTNFVLLFLLLLTIWIFSTLYGVYHFLSDEKRESRRYSQNEYISTLFYSTQPTAV